MALQKPLPRYWEPEEEETRPHVCDRLRTSTTLWIKQKGLPQLPTDLGELWRTATNGEGGSRLRPKWDAVTQHGKEFPNRVGNTTTKTTTQRMSLMWSRPTHEGKCPGRFQITDDFRQAQKKAEHR